MGNWNITIRGVGCHHNKSLATDANRMAAEFVEKLRAAGHSVSHASITYGGENDLTSPKRYLDDCRAMGGEPQDPRCGKPLGPKTDGECGSKRGVFKICPDEHCSMHGRDAPERPCRLVEGHEGACEPPVELQWR